jgi:hypothetical protein
MAWMRLPTLRANFSGIPVEGISHGLPGSMNAVLAPTPLIQPFTAVAMNSGPLSDQM